MSIDRGVDQEEAVHIHNVYTQWSITFRKEILAFLATWMDLEISILCGVGQTMRHQHQMLSLTCGIWKKDRLNFFAEQIMTQTLENLWFPKETVWGWRDALGLWDRNPIKFHCDDHCTTINVITSLSNIFQMYTCIRIIDLLYTCNKHKFLSQLYSSKIKKKMVMCNFTDLCFGVSWWPSSYGSGIVTAVKFLRSLLWHVFDPWLRISESCKCS